MGHLIEKHDGSYRLAASDGWTLVAADEAVPASGPVLLDLARFLAGDVERTDPVGVWIAPEDDARALAGHTTDLTLIAIAFPAFGDGRGYSHARILRDELGYQGRLRAVGDVLHDQLWHMARCGFDQFDLRADKDPEHALAQAFSTWTEVYMPASDDRDWVINRTL